MVRGNLTKYIRFKDEKEYKELIHALETNESERVKDIIFGMFYRGDFSF